MAEVPFQSLPPGDRREALRAAQEASGRRAFLLEKDIWVVQTLRVLFDAPFGAHTVFKGGTSLAKAYHAIRRFSEDIDVTYDIRAFAPDLVTGAGAEALPSTRGQEQRWSRAIRSRLAEWVRGEALAAVGQGLDRAGLSAEVSASGERLIVCYESLLDDHGFVRPEVIVEFGARATGDPHEKRPVACDAASHLRGIVFPTASPSVMLAERTFWEKATAMHVFLAVSNAAGVSGFPATGMTSRGWTRSDTQARHSPTARSRCRWRATRRRFFARRTRRASGSTTGPPFRASCDWSRTVSLGTRSNGTMTG